MINKYLKLLQEIELPDDGYLIKKLLPPNSILCLLYSNKPIKTINKTTKLISAVVWKNKTWISYGELVPVGKGKFSGDDDLNDHLDSLGEFIPNLEDEHREKFFMSIKNKKSFSNIESFSMEQVDHYKAYVSMYCFSQLKKLSESGGDVNHMEIDKHFVKPIFPFKTIEIQHTTNYNTNMNFQG